jgi:hypothetical protein
MRVRSVFAMTMMASFLALASGTAGTAQEACAEPQVPAPVDGAQASEEQMRAAAAAARDFIALSNVYQVCLANAFDAAKTQAAADGKALDPSLETTLKSRTDANDKVKQKVGIEINIAIDAYKQTHLK